MPEEISRLLENGQETIVRDWTEKVAADRRVNSDARLSYVQLIDHVPQIVEELRRALSDPSAEPHVLEQGKQHGRQRWRQGYELKEVVRELTLLRATPSPPRSPNTSRAATIASTTSWTRRFTRP
jgi:hypothetical protein